MNEVFAQATQEREEQARAQHYQNLINARQTQQGEPSASQEEKEVIRTARGNQPDVWVSGAGEKTDIQQSYWQGYEADVHPEMFPHNDSVAEQIDQQILQKYGCPAPEVSQEMDRNPEIERS